MLDGEEAVVELDDGDLQKVSKRKSVQATVWAGWKKKEVNKQRQELASGTQDKTRMMKRKRLTGRLNVIKGQVLKVHFSSSSNPHGDERGT